MNWNTIVKYRFPILLSCVFSLCAFGAEPAPDASVDFDFAELKTPVRKQFVIPNASDATVEVASVGVSCDCLNIMAYTGTIKPGSEGSIDALFIPDRTGEVEYTITVTFSSKAPRSPHVIHFSGWVDDAASTSRSSSASYYSLIPFARAGKLVALDESLYCAADPSLLKRATFVDVRDAEAYRTGHIQDSLNIPAYAVKTKEFLKNRPVVLVDEGYGDVALESLCRSLKASGFSAVSILRGGMRRWAEIGGAMGGFQIVDMRPDVSVDVFRSLQRLSTTLTVYSGKSKERAASLLPGSIQLRSDDPAWVKKVEAAAGARQAEQIVLVSDTGHIEAKLLPAITAEGRNVYRLKGGLNKYVESLNIRKVAASSSTVTLKYSSSENGQRQLVSSNRRVKKGCGCGK